MIENPEERTRAILWLLGDLDPGMPILTALGYLKAVEARLEVLEAELPRVERVDLEARYAAGTAGVSNLIKDMASHGDIAACAKTESVSTVARAIVVKVGPGKVSAHTAMMAATSLVNMYGKGDGSGPPF